MSSETVPLTDPKQSETPPGESEGPPQGIALCLSGGGYRAMVFHIGVLWRLNEAGYLAKLDRVSSVSGGSITAAALAIRWHELGFGGDGVASRFEELVVAPLRAMAGETIDAGAVILGALLPGSHIADRVAKAYRDHLFGHRTLQDLPDHPRFVLNATNVQSGALCRFSKPYIWDYRVGKIKNPTLELASAVGASSAFPPVLSPVVLHFKDSDFEPGTGEDLQRPPFTTEMTLSDGGVYDNMGIETAWKRCETILVSDAGGKLGAEEHPKGDWAQHSVRVLGVIDNQVRSLRKRQVIDAFRAGVRKGAYWGTRTDIADYKLADALPCPVARTLKLAETPTRLAEMPAELQERLINWGYAVCDAGLRAHVDSAVAKPKGFPYSGGVG